MSIGNTNSRLSRKELGGQMAQYAWILEVRPGYEEEYVRRHQEIWLEMVEALREAGIRGGASGWTRS